MKIIPDLHNVNAAGTSKTTDSRAEKNSGRFSAILDHAVGTQRSSSTWKTPDIAQAVPAFTRPAISPDQAHVLSTGEQALDLLEHCGAMLADGNITDGMLEPVARALDSKVRDLMQAADTIDRQDPLRGAICEIGVMSVVASMKIERGDFSA